MIVGADGADDRDDPRHVAPRSTAATACGAVYYSAFSPIPDASAALPLKAPPLQREHRLYQADWLMRFYGFAAEEILAGAADGMLDLAIDPEARLGAAPPRALPGRRQPRRPRAAAARAGARQAQRRAHPRRAAPAHACASTTSAGSPRRSKKLRPFVDHRRPSADARARPPGPARAARRRPSSSRCSPELSCTTSRSPGPTISRGFREAARDARRGRRAAGHGRSGRTARMRPLFGGAAACRRARRSRVPAAFVRLAEDVDLPSRPASASRCSTGCCGGSCTASASSCAIAADPLVHRLARHGEGGAARHPQDARLRALPPRRGRGRRALRRLVRARAPHPRRAAPFFVGRFAAMRWSILTPEGALHWDGQRARLRRRRAARARCRPADALEDWWRTYYRAIFNPARAQSARCAPRCRRGTGATCPRRALIPELLARARRRARGRCWRARRRSPRKRIRPVHGGRSCRSGRRARGARPAARARLPRCPLYEPATQTVFGEGPEDAPVMLVGEQPGDQEDLAGRPFVGPAGQLLDRGARGGRHRARRGLRHQCGQALQVRACAASGASTRSRAAARSSTAAGGSSRSWRWSEPRLVVALGATAAAALLGRPVAVHARARPAAVVPGRSRGPDHGPPLVPAAPAGCRGQGARARALRRRSPRDRPPRAGGWHRRRAPLWR